MPIEADILANDLPPPADLLPHIIFESILKGKSTHRPSAWRSDFRLVRICDGRTYGENREGAPRLEILTPLFEAYFIFDPLRCRDEGSVVLKLAPDPDLARELGAHSHLPAPAHPLVERVRDLFDRGEVFFGGKRIDAGSTLASILASLDLSIPALYPRFRLLSALHADPRKSILSVDIGLRQHSLGFEGADEKDRGEVLEAILASPDEPPLTFEALAARFSVPPYGWPEWETALLAARLLGEGKVRPGMDGAILSPREGIEKISRRSEWQRIFLSKPERAGRQEIEKAGRVYLKLTGRKAPEDIGALAAALKRELRGWKNELTLLRPLSESGKYPGGKAIREILRLTGPLLDLREDGSFLREIARRADRLEEEAERVRLIFDFYRKRRPLWDRLLSALDAIDDTAREALEADPKAGPALSALRRVAELPEPFSELDRIQEALDAVRSVYARTAAERLRDTRASALAEMERKIGRIAEILERTGASPRVRNEALFELQEIRKIVSLEESPARIAERLEDAEIWFDRAVIAAEMQAISR